MLARPGQLPVRPPGRAAGSHDGTIRPPCKPGRRRPRPPRSAVVVSPNLPGAERAPITVPSGHSAERALVTKCAEQAQCRAGTSN